MSIETALRRLTDALGSGKVLRDEPMSRHTTFRVGGPADIFLLPQASEDVSTIVRLCREESAPLMTIGNGSNLLVRDGGIRGAVMQLGERFAAISAEGDTLTAQGGALLPRVAAEAWRQGLTGMEFASGIPGSIGGAAAMNAGAYGGEMGDIVVSVSAVAPDGARLHIGADGMEFAYRHAADHRVGDAGLGAGRPCGIQAAAGPVHGPAAGKAAAGAAQRRQLLQAALRLLRRKAHRRRGPEGAQSGRR